MLCERTVLSLNAIGLTLAPWCVPQFSAAKLFPANIKRGHNHSMLDWCFQKKKKALRAPVHAANTTILFFQRPLQSSHAAPGLAGIHFDLWDGPRVAGNLETKQLINRDHHAGLYSCRSLTCSAYAPPQK